MKKGVMFVIVFSFMLFGFGVVEGSCFCTESSDGDWSVEWSNCDPCSTPVCEGWEYEVDDIEDWNCACAYDYRNPPSNCEAPSEEDNPPQNCSLDRCPASVPSVYFDYYNPSCAYISETCNLENLCTVSSGCSHSLMCIQSGSYQWTQRGSQYNEAQGVLFSPLLGNFGQSFETLELGGDSGGTLQLAALGQCDDGVDNDCNGLPDCADPSCKFSGTESACSDEKDNDCDLCIDEFDADCGGTEVGFCNDGIDNNCDNHTYSGGIDCTDPTCAGDIICTCTDLDEDGYGNPGDVSCPNGVEEDCDDNNASINPAATEICGDGVDNDCDGATDCNTESGFCGDGIDNDQDGEIDWDTQIWDNGIPTGEDDGIMGDSECRVDLIGVVAGNLVQGGVIPKNTDFNIYCRSSVFNVSSIEGDLVFGTDIQQCTFLRWLGDGENYNFSSFRCDSGSVGNKMMRCSVNANKSYSDAPLWEIPLSVTDQNGSSTGPTQNASLVSTYCFKYENMSACNADELEVGIDFQRRVEYDRINHCWRNESYTGCVWVNENCTQEITFDYDVDKPAECTDAGQVSCNYLQSIIGDCNAGDEFFKLIYNATAPGCPSYPTRTLFCSAQIALPFFSFFNVIAILLVTGFVYFIYSKKKY